MQRLDLADYLAIAEVTLGVPADRLARMSRIGQAESALAAPFASFGGEPFYPDLRQRAAILCSRLIRNHPLPDGNKRVALLCMIEFVERNGRSFDDSDQELLGDMIERVAAGEIQEADFVEWVAARIM